MPVSRSLPVIRFGLLALLGAALAACGETASPGSSATAGSGTTATVPAGLSRCPSFSGDVTTITDHDTAADWQYQSAQANAQSGDIEVYAVNSSDCVGMPDIRPGTAKLIASAVLVFKDAASANSAYAGMFGVSSSTVSGKPGALKGTASGFGATSVYWYSTGESMAIWVNNTKVFAAIAENVSAAEFSAFANSLK